MILPVLFVRPFLARMPAPETFTVAPATGVVHRIRDRDRDLRPPLAHRRAVDRDLEPLRDVDPLGLREVADVEVLVASRDAPVERAAVRVERMREQRRIARVVGRSRPRASSRSRASGRSGPGSRSRRASSSRRAGRGSRRRSSSAPLGSLSVRVKGTYGVHGPVTAPDGSFGNSARTRQRQMPGPKR